MLKNRRLIDNARQEEQKPVYLDCNATTPLEPDVISSMLPYLTEEIGNAGSRTHSFGLRAKHAVEEARLSLATILACRSEEVVFTSGATESNNLAIFGLVKAALDTGRKHIVSSQIEHKAILEPLRMLAKMGFEITLLPPTAGGFIEADRVREAIRDDTLLVTIMDANNETGVIQPIGEIAEQLRSHSAFLHIDAAQGFGKDIEALQNPRIDLISVSAHKIYGPKGIGALVIRRRGYTRPPINPIIIGGGQERGLRSGTLPVHLIVGLGKATEMANRDFGKREAKCRAFRSDMLRALRPLDPILNGDQGKVQAHVLNISFPEIDSEAVIVAVKDKIAISNGSACTSQSYEPSHVLTAMGLADDVIRGTVRISWCHLTQPVNWGEVVEAIGQLR